MTAPTGDGEEPFVDLDDVADVAVAALTQPGHAGALRALRPGGDHVRRGGRARRRRGSSPPTRATYARSLDLPAEYVAWRMAMFDAIREGRDARVSRGVEDVARPTRASVLSPRA